ncbi:MAG: discoidin domain-containing protein [Desulfarculus sp.]|nr:discoidin domain-containing protein [Desulfarculus sp.]
MAGLAFWTNFLSATAILPCALLLLVFAWRRLKPGPLALAIAGGLLGALPLIHYNATSGWPHLGLAGDLRLGPEIAAGPYGLGHTLRYLEALFWRGLPAMLGAHSPHLGPLPRAGLNFYLYLAALAGSLAGLAGLLRRGRRPEGRLAWLPAAVLLLNLAVVVGTHYGSQVEQDRPRYLLWLYLALPFCWAWLGQTLAQWRPRLAPALAPALALGLCLLHAQEYPDFRSEWGTSLLKSEGGFYFQREAAYRGLLLQARQAGLEHLYADETRGVFYRPNPDLGAYELDFLAGPHLQVVDFDADKRPRQAALVDASHSPGFYHAGLGPQLEFLGLGHQVLGGKIFHSFQEPQGVDRLLDPQGFTAQGLDGRPLGRVLSDGNFRTGFHTQGPARPGEGFVLDLGGAHLVAGLSLIPTAQHEVPAGLKVEGAGDDGVFHLLRQTGSYGAPLYVSGPRPFLKARFGRVETYFSARPLRQLRVTHLGHSRHHWSVQQALVFGPGQAPVEASWQQSLELALSEVERSGLKRIYADAWPAAHLELRQGGRVWTVTANRFRTVHGQAFPSDQRPLEVDVAVGSAILVNRRAAGLTARSLENSGVSFTSQDLGRFTLFKLGGYLMGPAWPLAAAISETDPQSARRLAGGRLAQGRWSSQGPQRQGQGLSLDLGQERLVEWVILDNPGHPNDFPRQLAARASGDGESWRPVDLSLAGPLIFSGELPLTYPGGQSVYRLQPAVKTRHLRLELAGDEPVWWWSVQGITLAAPAGQGRMARR